MTFPVPPQTGQVVTFIIWPSGVRCTVCCTCPVPPRWVQVAGCVPFLAPVPPQEAHASLRPMFTCLVTPFIRPAPGRWRYPPSGCARAGAGTAGGLAAKAAKDRAEDIVKPAKAAAKTAEAAKAAGRGLRRWPPG